MTDPAPAPVVDEQSTAPTEAQPPASKPIWQRPIAWIIAAAIVVVVAIAVIVPVAILSNQTMTVKGALVLTSDDLDATGGNCSGSGGYSDIADGAGVTVTDSSGKVIGLGSLQGGKLIDDTECAFFFNVDNVPAGQQFYGVEISHRGNVKYTAEQMKKGPVLSLGN